MIEQRQIIICICIFIGIISLIIKFQSNEIDENERTLSVCQMIKEKLSSKSDVLYKNDVGYNESISHYALTSTEQSVCSVLPFETNDVSIILKLIGKYRIRFSIKGGGHSFNPGFSSTKGIHISMKHFQNVIYYENNQTVHIGCGLVWDEVYEQLQPYNITVVGGRIKGVGVAGFVLGGGYGWITNQYGLSSDTVSEFELVKPDGEIVNVNKNSYPDIFFGLKGGFNNFGIVTNINMMAIPQGDVFAGILYYNQSELNQVIEQIEYFHKNSKDIKAEISPFIVIESNEIIIILYLFYNSPIDQHGIFDRFIQIKHSGQIQTQSYLSFIQKTHLSQTKNRRLRTTTVSITDVNKEFLYGLVNHLKDLNNRLGSKEGASFLFGLEPFLSTYLDQSEDSAYPHPPSTNPLFPLLIVFTWNFESDDEIFINQLKLTFDTILQLAIDNGQDVGGDKQIIYPNYALDQTPVQQIYANNLDKLKSIRKSWDPNNVMYLTGGFKF